jgi:hypothetical protein
LTEWVQNPDEATECSAGRDIFVGVGLADAPRGMTKRLTNETAAGLLGVIADVDIFWEGKPSEALPRNWKEAREFVESLDLPPTLLIHSGHGAHCWWLFSQPWRFGDGDHDRAADLSYRWQAYINLRAAEHGWRLDSIGDLARILRVPGTVNGKGGGKERVTIMMASDHRYVPAEIAEVCRDIVIPERTTTRTVEGDGTEPAWVYSPPETLEKVRRLLNWAIRNTAHDDPNRTSRNNMAFKLGLQLGSIGMSDDEVAAIGALYEEAVRHG